MSRSRGDTLAIVRERLFRHWAYKVGHGVAEDIVQETLLILETKYASVEGEVDLVKLSFKISTFVGHSMRRSLKQGREVQLDDNWSSVDPSSNPERVAMANAVRSKIKELGGRCAELLLLQLDGHSPEEIRDRMGAARVGTVYVWTHRCIENLRRKLGEGEPAA